MPFNTDITCKSLFHGTLQSREKLLLEQTQTVRQFLTRYKMKALNLYNDLFGILIKKKSHLLPIEKDISERHRHETHHLL